MPAWPEVDVSVIMPFADDEERVGALARRVAAHLRSLGLSFEILAVDEGSGDNSVTLLSFLKPGLPELKLLRAAAGRGFPTGAQAAIGQVLWLFDVARAEAPLGIFGWGFRRLLADEADAVLVGGRYLLTRRAHTWKILVGLRGRGQAFDRRFLARARRRGLRVVLPTQAAPAASPLGRHLPRLLRTLAPPRLVARLRPYLTS